MVQNELAWVLETIAEQWPGDDAFGDEEIVRVNRDKPEILETGDRTRSVELSNANVISATRASRSRTPSGTRFNYDVETVVSVRIEGLHESEWGHVADDDDFERLVRYAQHAINLERTYPEIDADDDIGRVAYQDARIENEQPVSNEHRDHYRTDFDVRLRGRECLPEP